jgi:hypothetical protein
MWLLLCSIMVVDIACGTMHDDLSICQRCTSIGSDFIVAQHLTQVGIGVMFHLFPFYFLYLATVRSKACLFYYVVVRICCR